MRLKIELGTRFLGMGRNLGGDGKQDWGDGRSLGDEIWEGGAREVIGRSWERVLDAESIRGWRKLLEGHGLHKHKRTHEREQRLPVWGLGKKENKVIWEEDGSWGGSWN